MNDETTVEQMRLQLLASILPALVADEGSMDTAGREAELLDDVTKAEALGLRALWYADGALNALEGTVWSGRITVRDYPHLRELVKLRRSLKRHKKDEDNCQRVAAEVGS